MKFSKLIFTKLYVVLLVLISSSLKAQYCGVGSEFAQQLEIQKNKNVNAASGMRTATINGITYIPISVHFVRHTDGSYSVNKSIDQFYRSMLSLNRILTSSNIQFYVSGNIEYVNNDAYLNSNYASQAHTDLLTNYKNATTANVWILDGWPDKPGIAGLGGPSGVELADLSERVVVHEFGHFLTLMHTFDYANGLELVTRTGGNCSTAGDGICDTDADPFQLKASQVSGNVLAYSNCIVTSNTKDLNNIPYTPPFDNFMSYYMGDCGYKYTPQQYSRMAASIPTYHSNYKEMTGTGISAAPAGLTIVDHTGYAEIAWTNSSGAIGTQIEYSADAGVSWVVMQGVLGNETKVLLSDVYVGKNYTFRARHLNSVAYSSTISYTPSYNHAFVPIVLYKVPTETGAIGGASIANTSLNNQSNTQDNYTFNTYAQTPTLFVGGAFTLNLKARQDPNQGINPTYFIVYLDDNADGDFYDAGELKYKGTGNFSQFTAIASISISSTAKEGYTRLRIRAIGQTTEVSPDKIYEYSETEDYLIKLINDTAPLALTGNFNQTTQYIELSWTDNITDYNYVIERSTNGINFTAIATTTTSAPTTFTDKSVSPNKEYSYRIRHEGGGLYTPIVNVITGNFTMPYCIPVSDNGCSSKYGIQEFAIPSISFTNNTSTNCGFTASGYSDAYSTKTIALVAGQSYTFTIQNSPWGGVEYFDLYLDANQNGVFDNGENLIDYPGSSGAQAVYNGGSFTVPASSINGYTRLRIRGYLNTIDDACTMASFGETEDYKVLVSGGTQAGIISPAITQVSENQISILWGAAAGSTPTGYSLKISTDGNSFSSPVLVSASQLAYTFNGLLPNTTYYIQIVASGTTNSEATTIWATTLPQTGTPPTTTDVVIAETSNSAFVYPNPVSGLLTIRATGNVSLVNSYGQLIRTEVVSGIDYWDLSSFASGIYFLQIQGASANQTIKIIKQ